MRVEKIESMNSVRYRRGAEFGADFFAIIAPTLAGSFLKMQNIARRRFFFEKFFAV